ncbi:MAG TPA: ATP-binding protein [Burkholderiales bacterium]|nr:ATP-binding protein [Burkholderiales bacterium]
MTKRLRIAVWASISLAIAIAALLFNLSAQEDRREVLSHAGEISAAVSGSLEEQASAALRDITNGLFGAQAEIRNMGGIEMMTQANLRYAIEREFQDHANIVDIVYLAMDGEVKAHITDTTLPARYPDALALRYYREHPDDTGARALRPLYESVNRKWLLPVAVPDFNYAGKIDGVLIALIDINYFQAVYARLNPRKGWEYTLATAEGIIVARYPALDEAPPEPVAGVNIGGETRPLRFFPQEAQALGRVPEGQAHQFTAANPVSGRDTIYAARRLMSQPFIMYVGLDREEHLREWRARTLEKLLGLALLAAVLLASAVLLLRAIKRAARDTEITNAVMRCAGDSILISRGAGFTACNAAALSMYRARSAEELVGRPVGIVCPERQPDGADSLRVMQDKYRLADSHGATSFEFQGRRLDGELFTAEINLAMFQVEEETYYLCVTRDITDRKRAEEEIRRLNVELESRVARRTEQLSRAKSQLEASNTELQAFSYSIAHDIRAPVRHILGFTDMIRMDEGAGAFTENVNQLISRIIKSGQRINAMIDSLLNLGKVSQKNMVEQEFDLGEIADSVLETLRTREPARAIDLNVHRGLRIKGDPVLMHMAMENLLSNAWKFTGKTANPAIIVAAGEDEAGCHFFVSDNGAGFEMKHAHRLFEPFARMHSAAEFPGTGVGLATVRRIVARHGGIIRAESAPGRGTTFYLAFGARDARVYARAREPEGGLPQEAATAD